MNVLFGGISSPAIQETHKIEGTITKTSVDETVEALANADSVILVRVMKLHFITQLIYRRWLGMEWQSQKHSMPFQR